MSVLVNVCMSVVSGMSAAAADNHNTDHNINSTSNNKNNKQ